MTKAASRMREIAENAEKKTPEGMKKLYDEIVGGMSECARMGMFGMGLTLELPEEMSDYLPHIVGDLRGGGFQVDIIAYQPTKKFSTVVSLFVTW